MGNERQGTKGGGFLQLFDWNAKSRKKLFSSKSDVPEQSKQKKRCDGNLPMTRFQMVDEDDVAASMSIKGSSEYSCASSVTDEEFCGPIRPPGVVARLMGLDSMPKSNITEPYSTPLFDTQSLRDTYNYRPKSFEHRQYPQTFDSISLHELPVRNGMEQKQLKVAQRPIEKFQAEILPPKSAKTIPITHHKLLSPIKSVNYIPPKDAAHIMEAAARIIEPGPRADTRTKLHVVGTSSVPLKVKDLKDKVQAAQKPLKLSEGSNKQSGSTSVKNFKEHAISKSWNGSVDAASVKIFAESEESLKNKGKSISLALQAKANVQRREGLHMNTSKTLVMQKEPSEISPNQLFKSQLATPKIPNKKPSAQHSSSVLRLNNQKQNCADDRGKLPLKSSLKGIVVDKSSAAKQRNSGKVGSSSKVTSRKMVTEFKDEKREVMSSDSERITRKKRSIDGNFQSEKNQVSHNTRTEKNDKSIQSNTALDRPNSWDHDIGKTGTDVVSFTFTAPMTRTGHGTVRSMEVGENSKLISADSRSKRTLLTSDSSKFSILGHNVKGSDALSTLLEQKLKELTEKLDFSQQKSGMVLDDVEPHLTDVSSSKSLERNRIKIGIHTDNLRMLKENVRSGSNPSQTQMFPDFRNPSPVSVLEHSLIANNSYSTDTGDSYSTGGSKPYSSTQAHEIFGMYPLKTFLQSEGDPELSDSASSTSTGTMAKRQEATSTSTNCKKQGRWELEYVKDTLCNVEVMYEDYASGRVSEIIHPHLYDQMESRKVYSGGSGGVNGRLLFDCVRECMDLRCSQYVSGGCKLWMKGFSVVRRKERLAEEIYKEISGLSGMGDSMVDELVDKDMSSQYGRWLEFEIEAFELGAQIESRILNSLIDEVVSDILVL